MRQTKYQDFLNNVFPEDESAGANLGTATPAELFEWALRRTLLGRDAGQAAEHLQRQMSSFSPSGNTTQDFRRWTFWAATKELLNESSAEIAEEAFARVSVNAPLDAGDYQVVESMLSLNLRRGDADAVEEWHRRGLSAPLEKGAEAVMYELLYESAPDARREERLDNVATAFARVAYKILTGPPYYSAAPHTLALASLCESRGQTLAPLVKGRLGELDRHVFGDRHTPLVKFGKPGYEFGRDDSGAAFLRIGVKVEGSGELSTGAHGFKAFTYGLPRTVRAAMGTTRRLRGQERVEREKLRDEALFSGTGALVARLILAPGVSMSGDEVASLRRRFKLAWEITQQQINNIACSATLELIEPGDSAG